MIICLKLKNYCEFLKILRIKLLIRLCLIVMQDCIISANFKSYKVYKKFKFLRTLCIEHLNMFWPPKEFSFPRVSWSQFFYEVKWNATFKIIIGWLNRRILLSFFCDVILKGIFWRQRLLKILNCFFTFPSHLNDHTLIINKKIHNSLNRLRIPF